MDAKIKALAKHLGVEGKDANIVDDRESLFMFGREEYLVLTDAEARERVDAAIADSLWAFRPEFLAAHSDVDAEVFAIIAKSKYEDASPVFRKLIQHWDRFVADAIKADGRGHFLSQYDGVENFVRVGSRTFYIYRLN